MLFALEPSPLVLYPFRYRSPVTGRWVRARYRAEIHVIAQRYRGTDWRVDGEPEIRHGGGDSFNPWRTPL